MAKKDWFDIAKDLVSDAAIASFVPGGTAIVAGKRLYNYLSEEKEEDAKQPSIVDLVNESFYNKKYDECLEYLQKARANGELYLFDYYRLSGLCHYWLMNQAVNDFQVDKEKHGIPIGEDIDDDDPRWKKVNKEYYENLFDEERSQAYDNLKECLQHTKEGDFEASKDTIAGVYWTLTELSNGYYEQRRFDMAAMAGDNIRKDAKAEYKELTKKILGYMDDDYESVKQIEAGDWSKFEPVSEEDKEFIYEASLGGMFSGQVEYHERQFIYIAKNIDALAGCYDDNIQWLFTIDALPKELQFPVGHPQPNSLYYAHPAKKGVYLPIEGADEELFNDKVRDFQRLAQCLGATEITFRSVKGHSLSENISKSMNVEVGGEYSGYEGSVNYDNKRSRSSNETMKGQREMVQRFNPNKAPYIPSDAAWLSVDPEWQSLVKQRLEGNMLHYSVRISSRKTMAVTESRMDDVKVAFKTFVANAHVNYSQQMERSFQREEETEWEISVKFKPLEDFDKVGLHEKTLTVKAEESEKVSIKASLSKLQLTANEQEYLDELRSFLEDDAEITPRERKMLDRHRQKLGISEERAKELEASLAKPQLTEDEQEYFDELREMFEDVAEITPRERKLLDRHRQKLGISEERAKELEKMV